MGLGTALACLFISAGLAFAAIFIYLLGDLNGYLRCMDDDSIALSMSIDSTHDEIVVRKALLILWERGELDHIPKGCKGEWYDKNLNYILENLWEKEENEELFEESGCISKGDEELS